MAVLKKVVKSEKKEMTMEEQKIAVITRSIKGFEAYVRQVYELLPTDKSIVVSPTHRFITVEHPVDVGRKYFPIQDVDDLRGRVFDKVEKTDDFFLLQDGDELYDNACRLVYGS